MCDDEDLRAFLKATDRFDCAHKAVQFAYDTAKNQARTAGAGIGKEKRPPDVRDGLWRPKVFAAVAEFRRRPFIKQLMGHFAITVSQRYMHKLTESVELAIAVMEEVNEKVGT